jgi:hypothetical protein
MVARGERPTYRIRLDGNRWVIDALPWISIELTDRRNALLEAREAIAGWLKCIWRGT